MILRSVEEQISFKLEVFPMAHPTEADLVKEGLNPNSWSADLGERMNDMGGESYMFVEILEVLEPIIVNSADWEGEPLHEEVLETVYPGSRVFVFVSSEKMWIVTGDFGADVVIEQEEPDATTTR